MTTATKTFTGANGTALPTADSDWQYVAGSGADYQIQSNQLAFDGNSNADVGARLNVGTWQADQFAKLTFGAVANGADGMGVAVRCGAANSGINYGVYVETDGSDFWFFRDAYAAELAHVTAGTPVPLSVGDDIALYVVGNALLPLVNGALFAGSQHTHGYGVVATNNASGVPGLAGWDGNLGAGATRASQWEAGTLQHATIDGVVSNGWTGAYTNIDEAATAISTTDVIASGNNPTNITGLFTLGNLTDPGVANDHIVMVYFQRDNGGRSIQLDVALVEDPAGTPTVRATRTFGPWTSVITAWQMVGFRLTEAEANAITDYTNLGIRFIANATGGGSTTTCQIAWATFAVPEGVAGNNYDASQVDTSGGTDISGRAQTSAQTSVDTAGAADIESRATTAARSQADAAGATDVVVASQVRTFTQVDSGGATDSAAQAFAHGRESVDASGATDPAADSSVSARAQTDAAGATDPSTSEVTGSVSRTQTDAAGATDVVADVSVAGRANIDASGAVDIDAQAQAAARVSVDAAGASDITSQAIGWAVTQVDAAGATDAATQAQTQAHERTEVDAGATDIAAQVATFDRADVDAAGATDSHTTGDQHEILVGAGYSDVSAQQIVRTSGDRVYTFLATCDSYPNCSADGLSQTLRAYRGDNTGTAQSFTRMDSADEPAGIVSWGVAIDSNDLVHIAYVYRDGTGDRDLAYITYDTTTDQWGAAEQIVAQVDTTDIGQGDEMVSLHLDSNGIPHIVYADHDGTRRRANYRNRIGGTWSSATQIDTDVTYSGNLRVWHPNIAFLSDGALVASWQRGTFNGANDATTYVKRRSAAGAWQSSVQVGGTTGLTGIDGGTAMMVLDNGRIGIGFNGSRTGDGDDPAQFYYSDDNGDTWTDNSTNDLTHNVGVGPGSQPNTFRLYYHGEENPDDNSIYYREGDGGSAWGSLTLYATGAFDSSVSTRWAQFHHAHPDSLDVVYWDQNYPNFAYYGFDEATVATDHTASEVDAAGASDVAAQVLAADRSEADTSNVSDITAQVAAVSRTQVDASGATDSVAFTAGQIATDVDDAGATDVAAQSATSERSEVDAGATDIASAALAADRTQADAGATDTASSASAADRTQADAGGVDVASSTSTAERAQADAGATDTASAAATVERTQIDSGATDSFTQQHVTEGAVLELDDAGSVDDVVLSVGYARPVVDSGNAEDVVLSVGYARLTVDSGASDTHTAAIGHGRTQVDASGATDDVVIDIALGYLQEEAAGLDVVQQIITAARARVDAAGATDIVSVVHTPEFVPDSAGSIRASVRKKGSIEASIRGKGSSSR